MFEVRQSERFSTWLRKLKDRQAQLRISARLIRLEQGLFGDVKAVGEGVRELKIDYGPGYRLYFIQRGEALLIILCAGDKATQERDIADAKTFARES
jgi:putative addiction module killer protein